MRLLQFLSVELAVRCGGEFFLEGALRIAALL